MVFHIGSERLNCANFAVPPGLDVRPPGSSLISYGSCELLDSAHLSVPPCINLAPPIGCLVRNRRSELFYFTYLARPPGLSVVPPGSSVVFHIGSERLNCANFAVPPCTNVRPPLRSGVFYAYGELNQVKPFKGFRKRVKDVFLHPFTDCLKRLENTAQQTFHDEYANFLHHGRWRLDTKQVFEPLDKGVYNMGFNPSTRVCKELCESLCEPCPHIGSGLFDGSPFFFTQKGVAEWVNNVFRNPASNIKKRFTNEVQQVQTRLFPVLSGNFAVPPVLNIRTDVPKESAKKLYCGTDCCPKECENRGSDTSPVDVRYRGLDVLPEVFSHFRPIIPIQPFGSFIKGSLDTVTYLSCNQAPVQSTKQSQDEVKLQSEPAYNGSTNKGSIHFLKRTVNQFSHMLSDIMKVHRFQKPVCRLNSTVQAVADFMTYAVPVNTINNLIDFFAQKRTKAFPIGIIKRLFQLISKLTYVIVNGKFLKHGTIISSSATAASSIVLLHDNVQFINTSSSVTNFLCRFRSGTACTFQRVPIRGSVFLRRHKGRSAGQPGKQHIDDVQQGNNLVNHKVDCRGKCVDDRSSHSTKAIFEVGSTGSQPVHALCKSTTHEVAVLIEVVNTFFQCFCYLTQGETDCTVHGNTFQAIK